MTDVPRDRLLLLRVTSRLWPLRDSFFLSVISFSTFFRDPFPFQFSIRTQPSFFLVQFTTLCLVANQMRMPSVLFLFECVFTTHGWTHVHRSIVLYPFNQHILRVPRFTAIESKLTPSSWWRPLFKVIAVCQRIMYRDLHSCHSRYTDQTKLSVSLLFRCIPFLQP